MTQPQTDDVVLGDNLQLNTAATLGGVQGFEKALDNFVQKLQELTNKHYAETSLKPNRISIDPNGKKYIRVVKTNINQDGSKGQKSVHCFINRENGDILKAASWKAPVTKNPRGNIYKFDALDAVTVYSAKYLR
jgi:hypothetical protein